MNASIADASAPEGTPSGRYRWQREYRPQRGPVVGNIRCHYGLLSDAKNDRGRWVERAARHDGGRSPRRSPVQVDRRRALAGFFEAGADRMPSFGQVDDSVAHVRRGIEVAQDLAIVDEHGDRL